eukprot:9360089-Lingulodinium_polyedra.AAC.1
MFIFGGRPFKTGCRGRPFKTRLSGSAGRGVPERTIQIQELSVNTNPCKKTVNMAIEWPNTW